MVGESGVYGSYPFKSEGVGKYAPNAGVPPMPQKLLPKQQPTVFALWNPVSITSELLQFRAVANDHEAAFGSDALPLFQNMQSFSDAGSTHPEHESKEVVGQWQLVPQPVVSH
nr:hypothetical protein RFYW14_04057 [Pseudorhizobium flavum]